MSEKQYPAWVDVIAGGTGGALAKSLLAPFQRIVVLRQLGEHTNKNAVALCRHLYHSEGGLRSFWAGNLTSMVIRVPYSGVQFLLYTQLKFFFQNRFMNSKKGSDGGAKNRSEELIEKFVLKCGAGGISAAVAGSLVYPGEVIRLRLMSGSAKYTNKSLLQVARLIYNETHSLRNFYKGLGASLAQRVPDILISFATYETVKYGIVDSPALKASSCYYFNDDKSRNLLSTIVGGCAAAVASVVFTYPLDVAKRRIGMAGQGSGSAAHGSGSGGGRVYHSIFECLHDVYTKEGMRRGLYAGAALEAGRCIPQVVLMWLFIEGIQKSLLSFVDERKQNIT